MTPEEQQGLAESVKAAKDYADLIIKPPLEQLGGILSDTIGYFRLKNKVNVILKAKKFLEEKGITPTDNLLPSIFVPLIEEAGNTDDRTLSDMFARLLAANLHKDHQDKVHPGFAKVLGQFSPVDAHVLLVIDSEEHQRSNAAQEAIDSDRSDLMDALDEMRITHLAITSRPEVTPGEVALCITNLQRLGIIEDRSHLTPDRGDPHGLYGIRVTNYGQRLMSCIVPKGAKYWRNVEGVSEAWKYRRYLERLSKPSLNEKMKKHLND